MSPYYEQDGITIHHGDACEMLDDLRGISLVLTDPPFGIALTEHGRSGYDWTVAGDHSQQVGAFVLAGVRPLPTIAFAHHRLPWPGEWRQWLVWDKGPAVGGGGDPATCWKQTWELIQVARTPALNGPRDSAVLRFWVGQRDYHWHPCQKPTDLLAYLIVKATQPGQVVFDPFMGSGSTLVAAKNLGRGAVGVEVEEKYCEIAAERLSQSVLDLGGVA